MKILFITNLLDVGGIEKNIVRLTRGLAKRGHSVTTASNEGTLVSEMVAAGGAHLPLRISLKPRELLRSSRALANHIHIEQPDVIHVFSAAGAVLLRVSAIHLFFTARRKSLPPVVASIMGLVNSPDESRVTMWLRAFLTTVGAKKLIIVSPAIDEVVRKLPVRKKRLVYMSVVGVEIPEDAETLDDRARASRRELGLTDDEKVVITIGRLDPSKSHDLFIAAAKIVLKLRNGVTFFVVGDGPLHQELRSSIDPTATGGRIRLLGERHDVQALLAASNVCVRPGIVEGFIGITVLEAQALARPVVAFATEDVKLAIVDGETGRLVTSGDVDALSAAIVELLDDDVQARALGERGRTWVANEYGIDGIIDRLVILYDEIT